VALGAITAFAAMGGTGLAGGLPKPAKKQYSPGQYRVSEKKVTICHNETLTLRISINAMPAHVRQHKDTVGPCETTAATNAKAAAAAKAAKAKKAKQKASATDEGTSSASSGPGASQGKGNGKANGNGKK
jgi:hypothetical protein